MTTLIKARLATCVMHVKYTPGCKGCKIQNGRYYRWYRRVNGTTRSEYMPCAPWVDCRICYPQ